MRAAVFARDGHRCQFPHDRWPYDLPCSRHLTVHHLVKASQGGAYQIDNLLSLCPYGNSAIEDHPLIARRLGLVVTAKE